MNYPCILGDERELRIQLRDLVTLEPFNPSGLSGIFTCKVDAVRDGDEDAKFQYATGAGLRWEGTADGRWWGVVSLMHVDTRDLVAGVAHPIDIQVQLLSGSPKTIALDTLTFTRDVTRALNTSRPIHTASPAILLDAEQLLALEAASGTSAAAASSSASSAQASASSAATAADIAKTSAGLAMSAATSAAASETASGNSATAALASQQAAAGSAANAQTSATQATASASATAASATTAQGSAAAAAASATAAEASQTASATSATSAGTSAAASANSATAAAGSASAAATSATNAATSATAASTSATNAAASAQQAADTLASKATTGQAADFASVSTTGPVTVGGSLTAGTGTAKAWAGSWPGAPSNTAAWSHALFSASVFDYALRQNLDGKVILNTGTGTFGEFRVGNAAVGGWNATSFSFYGNTLVSTLTASSLLTANGGISTSTVTTTGGMTCRDLLAIAPSSGNATVYVASATASDEANIRFREGNVTRWTISKSAAANLTISANDSAGGFIGNALWFHNASRAANFDASVWVGGTLTATGLLTANGGAKIGSSGATIASVLTAVATLDFPSIAVGASADLTVTCTGAVAGMPVIIGHTTAPHADCDYKAWVSSSGQLTLRVKNNGVSAVDLASATVRFTVINH